MPWRHPPPRALGTVAGGVVLPGREEPLRNFVPRTELTWTGPVPQGRANGPWRSLVACLTGGQEVAGSSPAGPTQILGASGADRRTGGRADAPLGKPGLGFLGPAGHQAPGSRPYPVFGEPHRLAGQLLGAGPGLKGFTQSKKVFGLLPDQAGHPRVFLGN